jgi:hypothetical protein
MTKQKIREWVAARGAKSSDAITMALILEVIELRARLEKLEASKEQGLLAKLGRNRK